MKKRIKMWNKWICLLGVLCLFACRTRWQDTSVQAAKEEQLQHAVRQLQAEGFHTLAGKLPLEEQLAESWRYQREKDGSGEVRYFVVSAKSKGDSFDAARVQAESLAKVQLAGLMETRIGQLVTNRLETSDGNTVMQTVASSKNLVTTRLSNVYPLLEVYRECRDGEIEVQLVMGCDRRWASEIAWAVISAEAVQSPSRGGSFSFSLTGLDQAYRNGESLRFSLIAEQDCYYHLFVFDADGVEQLYPGAYEEISLYKKGVEYFFPRNQWVAYSVEKGNYPVRYEQNILLVVATRKDIPFTGEVTVGNVLGWLRRIPEELRSEQYFSFLSE